MHKRMDRQRDSRNSDLDLVTFFSTVYLYIFLRLDKVCPWEGMEMKTDFSFREKVLLSEIVGKKDRLSNRAEQLSDRAKRG